jgi:hypothetical protein
MTSRDSSRESPVRKQKNHNVQLGSASFLRHLILWAASGRSLDSTDEVDENEKH